MSRVAKKPITIPQGVTLALSGQEVTIKGSKGSMVYELHAGVTLEKEDEHTWRTRIKEEHEGADAIAGSECSIVNSIVHGVMHGFERKLELVGVGYRAQAQGKKLNLSLGFSHPVVFDIPEGIVIETPSQTEVIIKGVDKQKVGQVAAKIRAYRKPEPYKGKGVRYAGEVIEIKETKKK